MLTFKFRHIMLYCYMCCSVIICVVLCIVCTVPLPPGVNPIAVDKYINNRSFNNINNYTKPSLVLLGTWMWDP